MIGGAPSRRNVAVAVAALVPGLASRMNVSNVNDGGPPVKPSPKIHVGEGAVMPTLPCPPSQLVPAAK